MKSFPCLVIITFLFIALGGCNQGAPTASEISQFHGSWQWLRSVGGIMGELRTPESTGHSATAIFTLDGIVLFYQDNILENQYRYRVTKEKPYPSASEVYIVEYLGAPSPTNKQMISYRGVDTLLLSDLCMDCYQHTYARIRK